VTPQPLPLGFGVEVDRDTRRLDDTTLFGGSPGRILRLTAAGARAYDSLAAGTVGTRSAAILARKLTDAGLLQPRPPAAAGLLDVTVVIPVRDRPELLDRCLAALGRDHPVVVVDDGSRDPQATAAVAARHGAKVVHRAVNGGAGVARNTGLAAVRSEFVAMVDSDCVPSPGWIDRLAAHFADPAVGVVAPRIVPWSTAGTGVDRYTRASGSLDLGDRAARVAPVTRVAYVPTAALVARRVALLEVAKGTDVFDPGLATGEDVDLIWRLDEAGWRIRYEPAVHIRHQEPATWGALFKRRFRYGTSAPGLAERHPAAIPPLIVHPLSALTVGALLARRPILAGAAFLVSVETLNGTLRRANVPAEGVVPAIRTAVHQTWLGIGRYACQFAAPLLAAAVAAPRLPGERHPWGRRLAAASLLLGPGVAGWRARRPDLGPVRYTAATIADDVSYGAGVWSASLRARNFAAMRPVIARRTVRIEAGTES
jgi:mycofactocin system glycosyltransferase